MESDALAAHPGATQVSEDGKKYAANLAKLLAEREEAIRLLERAFNVLDDTSGNDAYHMARDVDRFLMLVERP